MSASFQTPNSKPSLEARAQAELELRRRRAQKKSSLTFREFVTKANPRFKWFKHCEVLADVLQKVADGEIKRLMVFMPPRHGKSELISRLFSAYYLYRYPHRWVGVNSYAAELAYTLSRAARENFQRLGGRIKGDAGAVKHWETPDGGGFWAAGVGGPITGKGWHLGIIDDPLKNAKEAASETIREGQKEWYGSTFYTREEPLSDVDPNGALILLLTRWNEDDLAGWQLGEEAGEEPEHWHIVSFEAIKEEESQKFPDTCTVEPDWRKPGEALCPERRPLEKLRRIAEKIGSYFWNALFQQHPRPKEGQRFKRAWFKTVPRAPLEASRVRYWDKAATEGGGCFTAGVLIARDAQGLEYIEDVVRGQWSSHNREEEMKRTASKDAAKYGHKVQIWIEQEPGSGGKESAEATIKNLSSYPVRAERVTGDKDTRLGPFEAQAEAGNVKLVEGPWNKKWLDEICSIPFSKFRDQADATSGAHNKVAGTGPIEHGDPLW